MVFTPNVLEVTSEEGVYYIEYDSNRLSLYFKSDKTSFYEVLGKIINTGFNVIEHNFRECFISLGSVEQTSLSDDKSVAGYYQKKNIIVTDIKRNKISLFNLSQVA